MRGDEAVLVVTNVDDPTADIVITELNHRRIPVARFDSSDFPERITLAAYAGAGHEWRGRLETLSRTVDVARVRAIYFRRPSGYFFGHLNHADERFARAQAERGFGGILRSLPRCRYLNHPGRTRDAEYKPTQIATAERLGLAVPPTLVTNDLEAAAAFVREHGAVISKPIAAPPYVVDGVARTMSVSDVGGDELDASVGGTMHLFQVRVPKVADVRVTVVGRSIFAVRIDGGDPPMLDWRTDYQRLSYTAIELSEELSATLVAYLSHFDLLFGAFDFTLGVDGSLTWLECNPAGNWAWLEPVTGLPIAAAIADVLEGGDVT